MVRRERDKFEKKIKQLWVSPPMASYLSFKTDKKDKKE